MFQNEINCTEILVASSKRLTTKILKKVSAPRYPEKATLTTCNQLQDGHFADGGRTLKSLYFGISISHVHVFTVLFFFFK